MRLSSFSWVRLRYLVSGMVHQFGVKRIWLICQYLFCVCSRRVFCVWFFGSSCMWAFLDCLVGKTSFSSSIFTILGLITAKLYFSSSMGCPFESFSMLYAARLLVCACWLL